MNRVPSSRRLHRFHHVLAQGLLAAATLSALPAFADGVAPKLADPSQLGTKAPESARPAVGVPLNEANALAKQGRFADAMAKVREAEAIPDLTVYERYTTNRVKAAVAIGLGQTALAFDATEAAIASNNLRSDEQLDLIASLVHASYAAKDYARAIRWADRFAKDGGKNADIAALRMQSQYLSGDYAGAVASLQAQIAAGEAAGQAATERDLQLLGNAQRQLHDEVAATRTMEQLATRYPKPAYWRDLAAHVDRKAMSEHLFIDFFRFLRATDNLDAANTFVLANLSLQANFAGEALAVLDEGKAKDLFKGADLDKFQALRAKAAKLAAEDAASRKRDEAASRAAKDGNGLVFQGEAAIGEGRVADGIALLEQGLAKGGVRRVDEQRLRLGAAQALAGNKPAALKTLASVKGPEGLTEMAHLWWLYAGAAPAGTAVAQVAGAASAGK